MARELCFGNDERQPRCVVMAGGKSSRFASVGVHKSMAMVRGMPVISHVIDYWRAFTDDFIFVVKNGKESLMDFVTTLPIRAEFIEPQELHGIADGLSYVESRIDAPFIVVLGDCFCRGEFDFPPRFGHGIGVQTRADPESVRRNYSVLVEDDRVVGVEEKPSDIPNDLCGTGFYFFQPDVFDFIRQTGPSPRTHEREITDVLQTMVQHGVDLRAIRFEGIYVNVNTPADLDGIAAAIGADGNTN